MRYGHTSRQRRRRTSMRSVLALSAAGATLMVVGSAAAEERSSVGARAHSAGSVSVKDEGTVRFVKSSGSTITDEGPAKGTLPGKVRIRFTYTGSPTVSAAITIFGHSGEIFAHGLGRLSSPTSPTPSFKGSLTITGGTGRYGRAHGSGEMFGVFYRRSYGLIVQTKGTLRY